TNVITERFVSGGLSGGAANPTPPSAGLVSPVPASNNRATSACARDPQGSLTSTRPPSPPGKNSAPGPRGPRPEAPHPPPSGRGARGRLAEALRPLLERRGAEPRRQRRREDLGPEPRGLVARLPELADAEQRDHDRRGDAHRDDDRGRERHQRQGAARPAEEG